MKKGRMQAKDCDEMPILRLLAERPGQWHTRYDTRGWGDTMPTILTAFPDGVHEKVVLAKMDSLIRRGFVSGCACGCRGDFEITKAGAERLETRRRINEEREES